MIGKKRIRNRIDRIIGVVTVGTAKAGELQAGHHRTNNVRRYLTGEFDLEVIFQQTPPDTTNRTKARQRIADQEPWRLEEDKYRQLEAIYRRAEKQLVG